MRRKINRALFYLFLIAAKIAARQQNFDNFQTPKMFGKKFIFKRDDATISPMQIESQIPLQPYNSFGIVARAQQLIRIKSVADLQWLIENSESCRQSPLILGGGSNMVLTGDVKVPVLKIEIKGRRLVHADEKAWIVEAGAGEDWHNFVTWTLQQGWPGLENMALIPGTVGAAPVQNIGAYGVELQDRFYELDAIDLCTGQLFTLHAGQCGFAYRDSVFKHAAANKPDTAGHSGLGLKGRAVIVRVRFYLPRPWKAELGYTDLARKYTENFGTIEPNHASANTPTALQIYTWVCDIRRAKLPDPKVIGNAGSFFKNPTVTPEQCADIIARDPKIVHYIMADGNIKLAAGWLLDACGWKGKTMGNAGVYEKQALVLVNRGTGDLQKSATGGEVMTLAKAMQTSVYERFGIRLEIEPVVV